jgi:hypothetical protein
MFGCFGTALHGKERFPQRRSLLAQGGSEDLDASGANSPPVIV